MRFRPAEAFDGRLAYHEMAKSSVATPTVDRNGIQNNRYRKDISVGLTRTAKASVKMGVGVGKYS